MKKLVTLIVLVILAVVAAACSSGASAPALTLGAAPWKDGEKAIYDIVDQSGSKLGTSEFSFARDGDAWLLTATTKTGEVDEAAKVRLDGSTLRPLGKEKTIKTASTDATLHITYSAGRVQIEAVVNGKDQNVAVDIPANVLESDQLLMTLRAMPFAEGHQGSLVTVVSDSASKMNTTVRVLGQEKVQTPAGSVDAWRVEGHLGQAKHGVWYAVEAPFTMVQYDNGTTKMVLSK
jgi:hypothetical protein